MCRLLHMGVDLDDIGNPGTYFEYLCPLGRTEVSNQPAAKRPTALLDCLTVRVRTRDALGRISYLCHLPDAKSRLVPWRRG
jgi:hypothetical protein